MSDDGNTVPVKKRSSKEPQITLPAPLPAKVSKRDETCSEIMSYLREKRASQSASNVGNGNLGADADELFCRSMTENMRALNPYKKAQAKMYIMQVLMEVQFNRVPNGYRPITSFEPIDSQGYSYAGNQQQIYHAPGPSTSGDYSVASAPASTGAMYAYQ